MLKGTHHSLASRVKMAQGRQGKKPMLGHQHSPETKEKMAKTHKGMLGHKHSLETKLQYSLMRRGKPLPGRIRHCTDSMKLKSLYLDSDWGLRKIARDFHTHARTIRRWLIELGIPIVQWGTSECNKKIMKAMRMRPTKPEKELSELLLASNLPFKYVGDGEFVLGGKCPDFLNVNGRKQLIEVFGTYWHDPFDVARRTEHFRQYGFRTLIIWEDELKKPERLIKKVKAFGRRR